MVQFDDESEDLLSRVNRILGKTSTRTYRHGDARPLSAPVRPGVAGGTPGL